MRRDQTLTLLQPHKSTLVRQFAASAIATFIANPVVYDATLRNLERIGEAASRLPKPLPAWADLQGS